MMDDILIIVVSEGGGAGVDARRKMEGFREQRLVVLPEYMQRELARHALTRDLFVSDIGFFPRAEYHYRERPEGADSHIFIYCIEGEGAVELKGRPAAPVTPGRLAVIPAGIPHRYWAAERQPWSIYWFHLKGGHAGEFIRVYGLDQEPFALPRELAQTFVAQVDQALAMIAGRPYSLPIHIHCAQAIRWLLSGMGQALLEAGAGRKPGTRLDPAIRYMKEHIATTVRLPELARHTGISRQHLIHLFKRETGFSPIDYFLRLKMHHAANMLDTTDLTVKEVAAAVGMSDPYYFSRLFKKMIGHPPTDYRKIPKG
jgi:AraC-type DNA-binding domain-containing proteins